MIDFQVLQLTLHIFEQSVISIKCKVNELHLDFERENFQFNQIRHGNE